MATKYSGPNKTKGDIDEDDKSNVLDPKELDKAGNAGAEAKAKGHDKDKAEGRAKGHDKQPKVQPLEAGEHLPGDFRSRVENTAAGDLDQDPREPYPTGNPPDPKETFHRIHGYVKPEEGGSEAQAAQLDADPKT